MLFALAFQREISPNSVLILDELFYLLNLIALFVRLFGELLLLCFVRYFLAPDFLLFTQEIFVNALAAVKVSSRAIKKYWRNSVHNKKDERQSMTKVALAVTPQDPNILPDYRVYDRLQ